MVEISRQIVLANDEIAALTLQLEDIGIREETKKGKYTLANVPDSETAFADYLTEIKLRLQSLQDLRLAHSIANAVSTDAQAIAELVQEEKQAQDDRQLVIQMTTEDPNLEAPPAYTEFAGTDLDANNIVHRLALEEDLDDDATVTSGPSNGYMQEQVGRAIRRRR